MASLAQEFHISVTPLGEQDHYLVRLERVAPGVPLAEEQVKWPVDDWLAQSRQLMNDPLFELLQGDTSGKRSLEALVTQSPPNLVALGQQLYHALFHGSLRDSWIRAQAIAENQRLVLRLRLGLKGNRLPRLPWEVLHDGDRPLATGADVAFSRYQIAEKRFPPLESFFGENQPLKILMAIAAPSDRESLALKQEAQHLQAELRSRASNGLSAIQLKILEQPGREQLTQALEMGQYQIFHYSGHSSAGEAGGGLYLVSGKTGLTETLSGDDLAGLLANNGVQIALLNSCRGAYSAPVQTPASGQDNLAQALIKRGIPSVLAMAERIPDEVALTLTRLFYRNLNQGYPIDLSLSRARQGLISAYGSNQLYWALPVLYLQSEFDGFLSQNDREIELTAALAVPNPEEAFWGEEEEDTFYPELAVSKFNSRNYPNGSILLPTDALNGFGSGIWAEAGDPGNFESEESDPEAAALIADLFRQLPASDTGIPPTNFPGTNEFNGLKGAEPPPNQPPKGESGASLPSEPIDSDSSSAPPRAVALSAPSPARPRSPGQGKTQLLNPSTSLFRDWRRNERVSPLLWGVFGLTTIAAVALLGVWGFQNRQPQPVESASVPPLTNVSPSPVSSNLPKVDTSSLTALAIERFTQGDLVGGKSAVEELFNRGALSQGRAALEAVPKQQIDHPTINFLRGRLAWESIQRGNKDYSLDDARRYWEQAIATAPDIISYRNALGFAYYAESKYDRAIQVWFDALAKSEQKKNPTAIASNKDTLTTYAGLSLGLQQLAQTQPEDKKKSLLNESLKLRQKVMADDPINFQPDKLSSNWMWPEKAIQDWRSPKK